MYYIYYCQPVDGDDLDVRTIRDSQYFDCLDDARRYADSLDTAYRICSADGGVEGLVYTNTSIID